MISQIKVKILEDLFSARNSNDYYRQLRVTSLLMTVYSRQYW